MPLTVALHCSMVKKPQFVPPPPVYWAHHRVLSQGRAVAGVSVSKTGISAKTTTIWFRSASKSPGHLEITRQTNIHLSDEPCIDLRSNSPQRMVRLSCPKCGLSGQYRKQKLIERYGADIRLPDLREEIAQCERRGRMYDSCMVHYVELEPK